MGYAVKFDSLNTMIGSISSGISGWYSELDSTAASISAFVESDALEGPGADNIKQYMYYVHGLVVEALSTLLSSHVNNCLLYKTDYEKNVDTGIHAVILESELEDIKERARLKQSQAYSTELAVKSELAKITDLYSTYFYGSQESDNAFDTLSGNISNVHEKVNDLERQHLLHDFIETGNTISALNSFLDEQLGKGRSYKKSFQVESWAKGTNLQNLVDALGVQQEVQASKADEIEIAYKHEEERNKVLQKEYEDMKKAEKEKWILTGVCVVGSIAAIAVTGGAATPLVVGTISAVSGAVIAGGSTYIDQKYTGDRSHDWKAVGKSAFVGGVTGFMTGYLGAGAGKLVTSAVGQGIKSGSVFIAHTFNSYSMTVRIASYAVTGSITQTCIGAGSRFVGGLIESDGDINYAMEQAVDRQRMVTDAIIGGVTGGVRGIEPLTPVSDKQYLNEKGDIDWGKHAPNNGMVSGTELTDQTLDEGAVIDRYGPAKGRYTSPEGTPFGERSLPYAENPVAYHRYEVIKPIKGVSISEIAPAFGQPGGGTQFTLPQTVQWLIKNGFLREIK